MFLSLLYVNVGDDPDRPQPGRQWLGNVYHVHQRLWMAFPGAARRAEDPFFLGVWDDPGAGAPKPRRREAGFLFRIERDGRPRILVQSVARPDWGYAFQNAPYLITGEPDRNVREFDPDPCGNVAYRFRMQANVVKSKSVAHPDGTTRTTRAGVTIARRRRTEVAIAPQPMPRTLPVDPVERRQILRTAWEPWRRWLERVGATRGFRVVDEREAPLLMAGVQLFVGKPGKDQGAMRHGAPTSRRYNAGLFEGVLICTEPERLRDAVVDGVGHGKAFGLGLLSLARV